MRSIAPYNLYNLFSNYYSKKLGDFRSPHLQQKSPPECLGESE